MLHYLRYHHLMAIREKCPSTEFILVRIFPIRTEYGDVLCKTLYSFQIRENRDQKKLHDCTIFTQR